MAHTWSPHFPVLHARPLPHWWHDTTHEIHELVHGVRADRADRPRTPPKPHPGHYEYLEASCMSRAMEHL